MRALRLGSSTARVFGRVDCQIGGCPVLNRGAGIGRSGRCCPRRGHLSGANGSTAFGGGPAQNLRQSAPSLKHVPSGSDVVKEF